MMQGRNKSPKHDSASSNHANSTAHTPQQWFRPSLNRSVPNLAKAQHQNRSLGFSSIRDLARSSRRPLATLSANISQPTERTLKASTSLYGTLRDQCTPPPPLVPELLVSTAVASRQSQSSSTDSFKLDQSGLSSGSSDPTTLSPAKQSAFYELQGSPSSSATSMGNKASSIVKKPLAIRENPDTTASDYGHDGASDSAPKDPKKRQPATFSPRGSSLMVQVPRRRSSLTVIQLDNSHFNTHDPKQPNSQPKTTPLMEPLERRPSTRTDTLRPVLSNVSTVTPMNFEPNRESALSPPLLSPTSRLSSASSLEPSTASSSGNPRSSVLGSRIHLPKTFPDGPIPIPTPRLTRSHRECFIQHKRVLPSPNIHHPVPCMACSSNGPNMWKCTFCYLRLCPSCMELFTTKKRDVGALLEALANGEGKDKNRDQKKDEDKEKEGMKEVVADAVEEGEAKTKEKVEKEMEEQALKKVETTRKRETR